jgi:hypothetical protein
MHVTLSLVRPAPIITAMLDNQDLKFGVTNKPVHRNNKPGYPFCQARLHPHACPKKSPRSPGVSRGQACR